MPGRRPRRRHPHSALCVQGLRVSGLEGCVFWGLRLTYSEDVFQGMRLSSSARSPPPGEVLLSAYHVSINPLKLLDAYHVSINPLKLLDGYHVSVNPLKLLDAYHHQQISADFKARIPSVLARSHPTVRVDPNEHVSLSDWPIYPHGPLLGLTWLSPQRYLYVTHRYSA
eukprot:1175908-Prorocentrum_minimum.AAC.1